MKTFEEVTNDFLSSYGDMVDDLNALNVLDTAEESSMFRRVREEYNDFKTNHKWRDLQARFKRIKSNPNKVDEQFKLLMEAKALLLEGRANIASIEEDGWANFGMIMAVLTVTVGFTVACLMIPGISGTALGSIGVFTALLAPVYTYMRGYYNAYGSRDSYNGYAAIHNQQGVGSLTKQIAVAHMDKMLADTNRKLAHVIANKACSINKAAALIADKCSDQFLERLGSLETDAIRGSEKDIKSVIGSKYFKDFDKSNGQQSQKKDKNGKGNPQQNQPKKDDKKAS